MPAPEHPAGCTGQKDSVAEARAWNNPRAGAPAVFLLAELQAAVACPVATGHLAARKPPIAGSSKPPAAAPHLTLASSMVAGSGLASPALIDRVSPVALRQERSTDTPPTLLFLQHYCG